MRKSLLVQGLIKYCGGLILVCILLFLPAGTVYYWNGWIFIFALFFPMLILGGVLFVKAPELLAKRLNTNEKRPEQKIVILASFLMFLGGFVVAALDFRFGWSGLPVWAVALATAVFLTAYILFAVVMKENAYLSRTVEVQENQKVVDSGLYGIVRHPMYFATVLLFCSMPLVLGSVYSFIIFLIYPFILVPRIKNEEQVLMEGLPGYREYMEKVRYRLIPFIW
ncbi:MAG: isoprenylcysteine carboxylmethyltransferase family protein [Clostridiales bacterium]|nr:isoprenylcysteine carboxylmethyltransferase family protein [Clostridiales bacterium]